MTISIKLHGQSLNLPAHEAAALLAEIGQQEVEWQTDTDEGVRRVDPTLVAAIATLVVTLPGAILSTLQIGDRIGRKKLTKQIDELKAQLEAANVEAELTADSDIALDIRRMPTDAIADVLLK